MKKTIWRTHAPGDIVRSTVKTGEPSEETFTVIGVCDRLKPDGAYIEVRTEYGAILTAYANHLVPAHPEEIK